jgi:hypothetical protein
MGGLTGKYSSASQVLLKQLETAGAEKGLKPLSAEAFIALDGECYMHNTWETYVHPSIIENTAQEFDYRMESLGTYNTNNGMLAVIDHRGFVQVAPVTDKVLDMLEEGGYRRNSALGVPLSNGERLIKPFEAKRFKTMLTEAGLEWDRKSAEGYAEESKKNAAKNCGRMPDEVPSDGFMRAEGLVYAHNLYDGTAYFDTIGSGMRTREAGTFSTNNDTLAVVNARGELYIGSASGENMNALETAGYVRSRHDFHVPFSNGEIPLGWEGQQDFPGGPLRGGLNVHTIQQVDRVLGRGYNIDFLQGQYEETVSKRFPKKDAGGPAVAAAPG